MINKREYVTINTQNKLGKTSLNVCIIRIKKGEFTGNTILYMFRQYDVR